MRDEARAILEEIVAIRTRQLARVEGLQHAGGAASSVEVEEARIALLEARLRLSRADAYAASLPTVGAAELAARMVAEASGKDSTRAKEPAKEEDGLGVN